jgi:U3 small nucleolar RNA-associated protein 23
MRARRSKKYRKIMQTYTRHFSFRPPYQILLSSAFLRTCHSFHMPLQKYLKNTLHESCHLYVTKCTLAHIMAKWEESQKEVRKQMPGEGRPRGLGRPEWLPIPTEVPLRHCKHKSDDGTDLGIVSEERCLLDLLAGQPHGNEHAKNKQHYILATADADDVERKRREYIDVRERARLIPGVPIVYVKRSVMILEELSGVSERMIRQGEREKFGEGLMGLGDRKRKRGEGEDGEDEEGQDESGPKIRGMRKAKGPNPLSIKKKKVKVSMPNGGDGAEGAAEADAQRKKPTRRAGKRSRGKQGVDTEEGGVALTQTEV